MRLLVIHLNEGEESYLELELKESILYKYRILESPQNSSELYEYTKVMLEKAELYFQSPTQFNDPFDFNIPYETKITDKELKNFFKRNESIYKLKTKDIEKTIRRMRALPNGISSFLSGVFKGMAEDNYVYCLSKNCLNPLMWGYYSDFAKGICIGIKSYEYDKRSYIKTKENQFRPIPSTPANIPHNYLEIVDIKYSEERPKPVKLTDEEYSNLGEHMKTKDIRWKHEEEKRAFLPQVCSLKQNIQIPFEEISEIIFGSKSSPVLVEKVREIVSKYPYGGKYVKFYKIEPDKITYDLIKRDIYF